MFKNAEYIRLHLSGAASDVAHTILATHLAAVGDLDLQTLDLLRELDALRIGERFALLVDVANVQHLAHEVNDWLSLVESGGRD